MVKKVASDTRPLLQWTGIPEADELVSRDSTALLIGFCLDQQITVEKAFAGPLCIVQRLGTVDARKLAAMDPARVEKAFQTPPAIHRFPANMARRVQALCEEISSTYDNQSSRIWEEATDGADLLRRLTALPGFGPMKGATLVKLVATHFGITPPGWQKVAPTWPTLADVRTTDERIAYQTAKRAHKAQLRAQASGSTGG